MPEVPARDHDAAAAAWTISSAASAASRFSIFAITGMSAPRSARRALHGVEVGSRCARTTPRAGRRRGRSRSRPSRGRTRPTAAGTASTPGRFMPWCEATVPPVSTRVRTSTSSGLAHPQADRAVREVDHVVGLDRGRKPGPGDGERVAAVRRPVRGERQDLAVAQVHHVALDVAEPELRARGGRPAGRPRGPRASRGLARHLDQPRVVVARAVREVEPQDVGADLDQAGEDLRVAGGRPERGDDLGAAHRLEATPVPRARRQSRSRPLRNSSASLQRPGRNAQRDVAAAEAVERPVRGDHRLDAGLLEVLPPGARGLEVVEVAHDLPVVEARIADVQLALPGTRRARPPRRRAASSSGVRAARGGTRPRTRASWPPPRPGSGPPSAFVFAVWARPHTSSKNPSVLSAGRVCQTARARAGAWVPHGVRRPRRHGKGVPGAPACAPCRRSAPAARPRAPRSAPPGAGGSAPAAPGRRCAQLDSTSSSSPPVSAAVRRKVRVWPVNGFSSMSPAFAMPALCGNLPVTSIRAGNGTGG